MLKPNLTNRVSKSRGKGSNSQRREFQTYERGPAFSSRPSAFLPCPVSAVLRQPAKATARGARVHRYVLRDFRLSQRRPKPSDRSTGRFSRRSPTGAHCRWSAWVRFGCAEADAVRTAWNMRRYSLGVRPVRRLNSRRIRRTSRTSTPVSRGAKTCRTRSCRGQTTTRAILGRNCPETGYR